MSFTAHRQSLCKDLRDIFPTMKENFIVSLIRSIELAKKSKRSQIKSDRQRKKEKERGREKTYQSQTIEKQNKRITFIRPRENSLVKTAINHSFLKLPRSSDRTPQHSLNTTVDRVLFHRSSHKPR